MSTPCSTYSVADEKQHGVTRGRASVGTVDMYLTRFGRAPHAGVRARNCSQAFNGGFWAAKCLTKRINGFPELETSTKRKPHLAKMIVREIVKEFGVDRVLAEYWLITFEAKAPQPTFEVHNGGLPVAKRA